MATLKIRICMPSSYSGRPLHWLPNTVPFGLAAWLKRRVTNSDGIVNVLLQARLNELMSQIRLQQSQGGERLGTSDGRYVVDGVMQLQLQQVSYFMALHPEGRGGESILGTFAENHDSTFM